MEKNNETFCFLTFTKDDVESAMHNVEVFYNRIDEIVIIDSSNHLNYRKLLEIKNNFKVKIYHVIPTGHTPPLMIYALNNVNSNYVIMLDSGEKISEDLLRDFKNFTYEHAFNIRRIEKPFNSISWQVRIFQKNSIFFNGYLHEQSKTKLQNKIKKIKNKKYYIIQDSDLGNNKKIKSYLMIDLIERPLTYNYLIKKIPIIGKFIKVNENYINKYINKYIFILFIIYYKFYLKIHHVSKNEMKYYIDYLYLHYKITLKIKHFKLLNDLKNDIKIINSIIKYICFDDNNYVDKLSLGDLYNENGINIFLYLLYFKYINGKCATTIYKKDLDNNILYLSLKTILDNEIK